MPGEQKSDRRLSLSFALPAGAPLCVCVRPVGCSRAVSCQVLCLPQGTSSRRGIAVHSARGPGRAALLRATFPALPTTHFPASYGARASQGLHLPWPQPDTLRLLRVREHGARPRRSGPSARFTICASAHPSCHRTLRAIYAASVPAGVEPMVPLCAQRRTTPFALADAILPEWLLS